MARILQVTDFHLRRALPGHNGHVHRLSRHLPQLLEALALRIDEEAPDLVAVTGDLLDVPHALLDLDKAYDLKTLVRQSLADYRLVRDWLQSLGRPWMVLPGNHDYAPAFDVIFGGAPRWMRLGGLEVHAFHDWELAGNQALRVGEERRRFEAVLAAATEASEELHLQHFVVQPWVDYNYPLLYGDADDIAQRAAEAPGRRLLISGHWHGGTEMVRQGHATMGACPGFCEPPHPYRVFEMEPGAPITMREESLGRSFAPDRPLVILDRPGLLTEEGLVPRAEAAALLARLSRQAHVAIASPWHAAETSDATWRGVQYRHDEFFAALGSGDQADALCIYLPATGAGGRKLPAERITTEADLVERLAELFGVAPARTILLSLDADRRRLAREAGAQAPEFEWNSADAVVTAFLGART
ncbi:metallophosphoesterase family protein [Roseococcus sp. YIM B11640]|uniref:metallophosphoesterase family protein n=1 Tax=Roseococcus sp. YIM B11640 TaxID=3133973 RepID=UPI003C7A9920